MTQKEQAAVRGAVKGAVNGIEPAPLRERILDVIGDGTTAPGVLTLRSAAAVHLHNHRADGGVVTRSPDNYVESVIDEDVAKRIGAVQLISETIRLRQEQYEQEYDGIPDKENLPEEDDLPWVSGDQAEIEQANKDVLVGEVMCSRGFYLISNTRAAQVAIQVMRAYSRDEMIRQQFDTREVHEEYKLKAKRDVLELAAVAGTTAYGEFPSDEMREFVLDLSSEYGEEEFEEGIEPSIPERATPEKLASLHSSDSPSMEEYQPRACRSDEVPLSQNTKAD